jgi:serine phosphatase RsbU (regulator of sigma subunit)
VRAGDVVVLYTDGLPEGRGSAGFYGDERVRSVVSERSGAADAVTSSLLTDVLGFQDGPPRDDIAIVTLRVPDEPT